MSKIGKMPVNIPSGVSAEIKDGIIKVKGPKGELSQELNEKVKVALDGDSLVVSRESDDRFSRSFHGLTRALIQNMVTGVSDGYKKVLELVGVGYRAEMNGKMLVLNVGFSHPVLLRAPDGVDITVIPKENKIIITGIDKQLVGATAAEIRRVCPPEPYKGKGIKYENEAIRRKAGKTAGAAGTA
jgi:large subunit ribosomal protein L6